MKTITAVIAAAFIGGSCAVALAQSGSSAGSDVSTPRQNQVRPTPASPPVNRRGDEMAPMQGSNVSAQPLTQTQGKTDKHKAR